MSIISVVQPSDGETADAADVNDQINSILAVVNGGIDSDNLANNAITTLKIQDGSVTPEKLSTGATQGWIPMTQTPSSCTYLGNHSYSVVFNGVNLTTFLSSGMRLRSSRTVNAPTQSTSLNGTNQSYSKSSPNAMSFTDDYVLDAYVKMSAYPGSLGSIISRFNGTNGWGMYINTAGQVVVYGNNGGSGNYSQVVSRQSVPIGKWIRITGQLDMSAFTATSTTSYIMFDGVDTPAYVERAGTNPTVLVQAGNLEIGSSNGANFFPGKIAQAAIYGAKVSQANIRATISQGLSGSETSLISAYSFNNSVNDLNTTSANNLSANGSAIATNADSPFGGQADGSISATLDYGIFSRLVFSTNTTAIVQVPEGCTLPTSGGIVSIAYSSAKAPYGMPVQANKWQISSVSRVAYDTIATTGTPQWVGNMQLSLPAGQWLMKMNICFRHLSTATLPCGYSITLSNSTSTYSTDFEMCYLYKDKVFEWRDMIYREGLMDISTQTPYYLIATATTANTTAFGSSGSASPALLTADFTYL